MLDSHSNPIGPGYYAFMDKDYYDKPSMKMVQIVSCDSEYYWRYAGEATLHKFKGTISGHKLTKVYT